MWGFGACCHKILLTTLILEAKISQKKVHIKLNNDTDILQWFYIRSLTQIDMGKIFKESNLFPIDNRLINCMKKTYALA